MDVLVCAAQVPFMRGGLELLAEGLVGAFGAAGHSAELVRIPTTWEDERILDAPLAWRMVPLNADVVVCLNFPSYFARHPRKVVWLAHQHRAAYDAIGQAWSTLGLDDDSLEVHRQLVEWDTRAIEEAAAVFTISQVVADRLARFNGVVAEPVYHPPPRAGRLRTGRSGDYVFLPTRFEVNKRPGLMVDALAACRRPVRGILAGTGGLAGEIDERVAAAGLGDRLERPGHLTDDELIDRYADALAVLYAPIEEDYGYVTLEAFLAGKPVITTTDAGGVLEWVEDGVTGIVTDGSPAALGAAIDRLADDRELASRMGRAGRERVVALDWGTVVERLLAGVR